MAPTKADRGQGANEYAKGGESPLKLGNGSVGLRPLSTICRLSAVEFVRLEGLKIPMWTHQVAGIMHNPIQQNFYRKGFGPAPASESSPMALFSSGVTVPRSAAGVLLSLIM